MQIQIQIQIQTQIQVYYKNTNQENDLQDVIDGLAFLPLQHHYASEWRKYVYFTYKKLSTIFYRWLANIFIKKSIQDVRFREISERDDW